MTKEFVTYEIAKRLKELGFNEFCLAEYDASNLEKYVLKIVQFPINTENCFFSIPCPLWQQSIDWLRTEHNTLVTHDPNLTDDFRFDITKNGSLVFTIIKSSYKQAREAAILKALELI